MTSASEPSPVMMMFQVRFRFGWFARVLWGAVLALTLTASGSAVAQEPELVVSTAREVAKQGLSAYDAGDYEEAFEKLFSAYGAVKLPTLALYTARSAEKLGRLVKAAELYLEASSLPAEESWQSGQFEAQAKARVERVELLPRIPRLTVTIHGGSESPEVRIDEVAIPASLVGAEQLVDPGSHVVTVISGPEQRTQQFWAEEGSKQEVTFELPAVDAAGKPVAYAEMNDGGKTPGKMQRTFGWITIGVGGAAFLTGAGIGIYLVWKEGRLISDGNCTPEGSCYTDHEGPVKRFNTRRTWSTAGIVAGSVLAAAGVTLVLTAPKPDGNEVALRALPGGLELAGTF